MTQRKASSTNGIFCVGINGICLYVFILILKFLEGTVQSEQVLPACATELKCWATCDLWNCGCLTRNDNSSVTCQWHSEFRDLSIKFFQHRKLGKIRHKCSDISNSCEASSLVNKFRSLKARNRITGIVSSKSNLCSESDISFTLCDIAKPNSPHIDIKTDNVKQFLTISDVGENCISPEHLTHRLNYTIQTADGKKYKSVSREFFSSHDIHLHRGMMYNFSLETRKLTSESRVYSDPATVLRFVTVPKIVKDDFLVECHKEKGILVSWKKDGIVDHFDLKLTNQTTGTIVSNKSGIEAISDWIQYEFALNSSCQEWWNYSVTLTAYNKGGVSEPVTKILERHQWKKAPFSCEVVDLSTTSLRINWTPGVNDKIIVTLYAKNKLKQQKSVNNGLNTLLITDLESCTNYMITITTKTDVLCTTQAQTTTTKHLQNLDVKVDVTTPNTAVIHFGNQGSCPYNTFLWKISKSETWKKVTTKGKVELTNLKSNTAYKLTIAERSDMNKIRTEIFRTTQELPRNPRILKCNKIHNGTFLVWDESNKKGMIKQYEITFNSSINLSLANCMRSQEMTHLCRYTSSVSSVLLSVFDTDILKLRGCNEIGCSDWVSAYVVEIKREVHHSALVVASVASAVLLLSIVLTGWIFWSRKYVDPVIPKMHPYVQAQLEEELLAYRKMSCDREKLKKKTAKVI